MTKLLSTALLAALMWANPVRAQVASEGDSQLHVVRPGETLWDLADRFLDDPFLWPEIFSANRSLVVDPHRIYPDWRLRIPGRFAEAAASYTSPAGAARSDGVSRTVFFSDLQSTASPASTVISTPADELPVVPAGVLLAAASLRSEADVRPLGRLIEVIAPTIVPRRVDPQIQPYDRVNMTVLGDVRVGERVHLVRPGRMVEPYGRVFLPTGSARVLSVTDGVATVEVDHFYEKVAVGDLALEIPAVDVGASSQTRAATPLAGTLIAFEVPQPIVGTEDRAFVNIGASSGVLVGDELVAYIPAAETEWGVRPEVLVARLQVLRTEATTATVRVIALDHPALEVGLPVRRALE